MGTCKTASVKKPMTREAQRRAASSQKVYYVQKSAANKLRKTLSEPGRKAQEQEFAAAHAGDSNQRLYEYVKMQKRRLGKQMKPVNTVGYVYLTRRLGLWSEIMGRVNAELRAEKNAEQARRAASAAERASERETI